MGALMLLLIWIAKIINNQRKAKEKWHFLCVAVKMVACYVAFDEKVPYFGRIGNFRFQRQ
jgi:hypothetical protein